MKELRKVTILGVGVTAAVREEILEYVDELLLHESKKGYFVTPNPEMLVLAQRDSTFRTILNHAQLSLVDGVGLLMAGNLLGKTVKERFSGTDFLDEICKRYVKKPVKLGFLGGRPHVAEKAAECLLEKYPGLTIAYVSDEWTRQGFANARLLQKKAREKLGHDETSQVAADETIDLLFVAFGFPKQEYFIAEHLSHLPVRYAIGVGGAFDYLGGNVRRAPRLIRAIGLEWLFRLMRQPWRLKRQLALFTFVKLVIREFLTMRTHR